MLIILFSAVKYMILNTCYLVSRQLLPEFMSMTFTFIEYLVNTNKSFKKKKILNIIFKCIYSF